MTEGRSRFGGQICSVLSMPSLCCPFSIQEEMSGGSWTESLRGEAQTRVKNLEVVDFPGGTVVKNPPVNAGDTGSSPGL